MKLKRGTYYIGDPCYIFDESWNRLLDEHDYFIDDDRIYNVDGHLCCMGNTAYGDGTYYDTFNRQYCVDSGMLGILPIECLNIDNKKTVDYINKSDYMHIVEFVSDFECDIIDGIFVFDNIVINTNIEDEYYDEDDEF